MIFVYILYSKEFDRFYVGMTYNLENRLSQHNTGQVKSTKPFLPWKIIHHESHPNRLEARKREKYLKSSAGRRWRKNNLGM
ncbi:GIY-YIG nuclease family protein [Flavobacteriaceae bacterium XHP0103]|uniref:GIY-YIG nuclease family protein n=1 Tax=Marixanthotalea marina TaxID=2844359 RepID=UPI002989E2F5|nr:GIY-YIG nuclease family protein [Marixanthotalea marina]MBU3820559.1 GIY-YIG nuclease family protein [Marixanthotalea marina]